VTVAALVLAAGPSRRLGRPKQLLSFGGRPLVRIIADRARNSACDRVVVVLGAHADAIAPALRGADVETVVNGDWPEGVASSIRCGVVWAEGESCSAIVVLVCDQPALDAAHIDRLVGAYRAGSPRVASRYAGTLGVPALFDRTSFSDLRGLQGDEGARHILRSARDVAAVDWEPGSIDIDTQEEAARVDPRLA
jgi:molybdenum cofactor cytidylyltransferase